MKKRVISLQAYISTVTAIALDALHKGLSKAEAKQKIIDFKRTVSIQESTD